MHALRRLFKFDYLSPLDYDACKERFTSEYREKLRAEDRYQEVGWLDWYTFMYQHRKGGILVESDRGRSCFSYRITLEGGSNGTVMHCTHNPFDLTALFFPALLAVSLFVLLAVGLIDHLVHPATSSPQFIVKYTITFACSIAVIVGACFYLENRARSAVHRLVYQLVGGVPME